MARLDAGDIYAAARRAGFSAQDAVTATAIALAESGGRTTVLGDRSLTNATWGPSVGLWQIRTLNRDQNTGRTRDLTRLLRGDPTDQARAALDVFRQAGDWRPWTVFTTGAYRQYLGQAQEAARGLGDDVFGDGGWLDRATVSPQELATSATSAATGAVSDVLARTVERSQGLITQGVILVAAVGLVIAGAVTAARRRRR